MRPLLLLAATLAVAAIPTPGVLSPADLDAKKAKAVHKAKHETAGKAAKAVKDQNGAVTPACNDCIAALDKESAAQTDSETEHKKAENLADDHTTASSNYAKATKDAKDKRSEKAQLKSDLDPLETTLATAKGALATAEAAENQKQAAITAAIKLLTPLEKTETDAKTAVGGPRRTTTSRRASRRPPTRR